MSRLNVHQLDLPLDAPGQNMPARQLRPVVASNHLRHTVFRHDPLLMGSPFIASFPLDIFFVCKSVRKKPKKFSAAFQGRSTQRSALNRYLGSPTRF
jgi:hypothetical protein